MNLAHEGLEAVAPARPVRVLVEWGEGEAKQRWRAEDLIWNGPAERTMEHVDWVFAGSKVINGTFMSSVEGQLITTYRDPFTILDGDRFEPLWRFRSRFALHGGAKYSPDGRYVFLGSRDGWVSKYDLYSLQAVAEIRVGINTRNIAVSSDGKWVMAGNYLPHSIVVLNADDLSLFRVVAARNENGQSSRVSAVYDARPRRSFIVALKDFKEVWEMSYDPNAKPIYPGFVHNFRLGQEEGIEDEPQPFARRRVNLKLDHSRLLFSPDFAEVIGRDLEGRLVVFNLDARRRAGVLSAEGSEDLSKSRFVEGAGAVGLRL